MQFPRLVYKSASSYQLVENQKELEIACSYGYFRTVPEALQGVAEVKHVGVAQVSAPVAEIEPEAPVVERKKPGPKPKPRD